MTVGYLRGNDGISQSRTIYEVFPHGILFSKKLEASKFIPVVILFYGIIFGRLCAMENAFFIKKFVGRGTTGKSEFSLAGFLDGFKNGSFVKK